MIRCDFLVIGSGVAGLMFALDVAEHGRVVVLSKDEPAEGSTRYAQGGIASVSSPLDSFDAHIEDTVEAGAGLCHEEVVRSVVLQGPERIQRLVELGTEFDRGDSPDQYELGREGGHSARRILHTRDATGAEIHRAVFQHAKAHPNISLLPYHLAIDFVTQANSQHSSRPEVIGAYALDTNSKQIVAIASRVTMLATGGTGKVYLYTSNPDVSTGDGIAMAFRAGADVANMEFIQFHPTCLFHPQAKSFLITEAMRGEGARLCDQSGKQFMANYDERGELAPRDIVARAIDDHMKTTGVDYVNLDISHLDAEFIKKRFPTIYEKTKEFGFDITREAIPVVPAAHYCCGGVITDSNARTKLPRLYAAGETAFTGLHGANRLASNSLLEAAVFADRAARDAIENLSNYPPEKDIPEWDTVNAVQSSEEVIVSHSWDEVRRIMWNLVGIVRSDKRLRLAQRRIEYIRDEVRDYYWKFLVTSDLVELRNIIQIAEIIIRSAQTRRESRGLHYNSDCPERDDENWLRDTILSPEIMKE